MLSKVRYIYIQIDKNTESASKFDIKRNENLLVNILMLKINEKKQRLLFKMFGLCWNFHNGELLTYMKLNTVEWKIEKKISLYGIYVKTTRFIFTL